jgi:putative polyhydroxyalkanoate system protein
LTDIEIHRGHTLGRHQARQVAEKVADELSEKLSVSCSWQDEVLHFQRAGLHGELEVTESEVRVSVRLGLLMLPMKPMLEQHINHYLDELVGPA